MTACGLGPMPWLKPSNGDAMWAAFRERVKGWKTIIWSVFLVLFGIVGTIIASLNSDMIALMLPEKYRPYAPVILIVIGAVTGALRVSTTGPVGVKGDDEPSPDVKAGD